MSRLKRIVGSPARAEEISSNALASALAEKKREQETGRAGSLRQQSWFMRVFIDTLLTSWTEGDFKTVRDNFPEPEGWRLKWPRRADEARIT